MYQLNMLNCKLQIKIRGRTLATRWLLWKSSKRHIMSFLNFSAMLFDHDFFCYWFHQILWVTTIFGKSRERNVKTLRTRIRYISPDKTNVSGLAISVA